MLTARVTNSKAEPRPVFTLRKIIPDILIRARQPSVPDCGTSYGAFDRLLGTDSVEQRFYGYMVRKLVCASFSFCSQVRVKFAFIYWIREVCFICGTKRNLAATEILEHTFPD